MKGEWGYRHRKFWKAVNQWRAGSDICRQWISSFTWSVCVTWSHGRRFHVMKAQSAICCGRSGSAITTVQLTTTQVALLPIPKQEPRPASASSGRSAFTLPLMVGVQSRKRANWSSDRPRIGSESVPCLSEARRLGRGAASVCGECGGLSEQTLLRWVPPWSRRIRAIATSMLSAWPPLHWCYRLRSLHRYVGFLKWLTLSLFAYVGVVFTAQLNWADVARGASVPNFAFDHDSLMLIVALLGTTISPFLFFWQSAQEVEEEK